MGQGGSGAQDKELPAESHQKLPNKYVRQESVEGGDGEGGTTTNTGPHLLSPAWSPQSGARWAPGAC